MATHAASHVILGWDPMWVSTCVLAITYAVIISEKVNRAIVALEMMGAIPRVIRNHSFPSCSSKITSIKRSH